MTPTTRRLARVGAASLSTFLLVVAVVKGQGCQRPDAGPAAPVPTTEPLPNRNDPSAPDAATVAAADAAADDAQAVERARPAMPATKSGIFIQDLLESQSNGHPMMGATKSAGFIPEGGWGVGLGSGQPGTQRGGKGYGTPADLAVETPPATEQRPAPNAAPE